MPPLMLADDEALALVLGLIAAHRAGLTTTTRNAGERAAAKLRRVPPERTRRRLDALLATTGLTLPTRPSAGVDADVLFPLVEAARERRPVAFSYIDRDGRHTVRTLEPYGIVAHSGRWYVTGSDSASGQVRTFRLDRLRFPRTLPGHFDVPDGFDPTGAVLDSLATTPWAHAVSVRVRSSRCTSSVVVALRRRRSLLGCRATCAVACQHHPSCWNASMMSSTLTCSGIPGSPVSNSASSTPRTAPTGSVARLAGRLRWKP